MSRIQQNNESLTKTRLGFFENGIPAIFVRSDIVYGSTSFIREYIDFYIQSRNDRCPDWGFEFSHHRYLLLDV